MIDHYNYEDNKIKDYVNDRLVQLKVNEIPTYTNGIHMNTICVCWNKIIIVDTVTQEPILVILL